MLSWCFVVMSVSYLLLPWTSFWLYLLVCLIPNCFSDDTVLLLCSYVCELPPAAMNECFDRICLYVWSQIVSVMMLSWCVVVISVSYPLLRWKRFLVVFSGMLQPKLFQWWCFPVLCSYICETYKFFLIVRRPVSWPADVMAVLRCRLQ